MNRPTRVWLVLLTCLPVAACGTKQYRLDITGAGQALSRVTSDEVDELRPAVSPDGGTLLFDAEGDDERTIVSVDPSSGARRTIYTATTSASQEVAWSPEGDWFAYTTNAPGTWSLVRSMSRSPNSAVAVLVSGEVAPNISNPSVSPDGNRVAFATLIRDRWQIATAYTDGSNFTLLGEGMDPEWSPDGTRLVFNRRVNDWWHIYTIDAESGVEVVQITSGETDNLHPTWSPDGEYILFSSNRGARKASKTGDDVELERLRGPFNLYAIDREGTGLVQFTDGEGLNIDPRWGDDGWIYFASNQVGNFDIWRLRPGQIR